jgi:hypothetical protein
MSARGSQAAHLWAVQVVFATSLHHSVQVRHECVGHGLELRGSRVGQGLVLERRVQAHVYSAGQELQGNMINCGGSARELCDGNACEGSVIGTRER